jgi:hypothetical protein
MDKGLLRPTFQSREVLRVGKLVRSVRMIRMTRVMASLQMLIKCLLGSSNTLFWSFSHLGCENSRMQVLRYVVIMLWFNVIILDYIESILVVLSL